MDRSILAHRNVRHITLMIALASALILAFATVAYAATIYGNAGNNTLVGTSDTDQIIGRDGNDEIRGLAGNDVLRGSPGQDRVFGGSGEDTLTGDKGDDLLVGDDDKQSDEFYGGQGRDTCVVSAQDHASHNLSGCEVVTNNIP
jgi:Ca2+-binding RTX toxin-like protein